MVHQENCSYQVEAPSATLISPPLSQLTLVLSDSESLTLFLLARGREHSVKGYFGSFGCIFTLTLFPSSRLFSFFSAAANVGRVVNETVCWLLREHLTHGNNAPPPLAAPSVRVREARAAQVHRSAAKLVALWPRSLFVFTIKENLNAAVCLEGCLDACLRAARASPVGHVTAASHFI